MAWFHSSSSLGARQPKKASTLLLTGQGHPWDLPLLGLLGLAGSVGIILCGSVLVSSFAFHAKLHSLVALFLMFIYF